jgi:hypothetical protein
MDALGSKAADLCEDPSIRLVLEVSHARRHRIEMAYTEGYCELNRRPRSRLFTGEQWRARYVLTGSSITTTASNLTRLSCPG